MQENIRVYIRKLLFERFFKEASLSPHYSERLNTRIKNAIPKKEKYNLTSKKISEATVSKAVDVVKIIQNIDFPVNDSYAIKLINLPEVYKHLDLDKNGNPQIDRNTGRTKESRGDTIWVLIRDNEIKTIFLRGSEQKNNIPDIQYYIKAPLNLIAFYNGFPKDENGHMAFKMGEFEMFLKNKKNNQEVLPKVYLSIGTWLIDEKNKALVQKSKKGNKIINKIEDYENNLNDDDLMKVWNVLEGELVMEFFFK